MKIEKIKISDIPSILWGKKSNKVFIAVHGNMSNKEDEVIKIFAEKVASRWYQLLSFDLPEHGERKDNKEYLCKVQNCVKDLKQVIEYAKKNYVEINLWACSMGAYFSLLAYKDEDSDKFNCKLSILENGEHYFHKEEQLNYYKKWLNKAIS